jgi:lipid-binding SYLF domain-containing protein
LRLVNPLGIDPAITTGQYSGKQTKKGPMMKKELLLALVCTAVTLPAVAQNKIDNRLGDSAEVLKQMLAQNDGIPQNLLDKSACVLVFPAVKKVGIGLGVTYGRGVIVCRSGTNMNGPWSAPAMYKLDVGSLGVQLGSSSTDYVLLVETKTGAQKILSGKAKLGADATAIAGPTGAKAVAANDPGVDVLTYSRAKGGLFAGASIASASMDTDDDANKVVYGKPITATEIVREGAVTVTPSGKALDSVLQKASPKRSQTAN